MMETITKRKGFLLSLGLLLTILFTTSCTNLKAVHEWSQTSLEATQYNQIIATYADTPQRLKRYNPEPNVNYDEVTKIRENQGQEIILILSVVSDYMSALATLSSDTAFDYSKDIKSVTNGIKGLNKEIPDVQLDAIGSIVTLLGNAATQQYQAKQVAKIIEQANDPIQTILKGDLRTIVDGFFRIDLEQEKSWMTKYYEDLQLEGKPNQAAVVSITEWMLLRSNQNEKRLDSVNAYVKVLDNVSEGHQKLYDNRNKLDTESLIKNLLTLSVKLQEQIVILNKPIS
jgi:hypothetical protein